LQKLVISLIALVALSSPALAEDASPQLCAHYPGHVDVEGRFGQERKIGEVSIFLPLGCTEDVLLFGDLRFKGDSQSNREGNAGVGLRALKDEGILGGYAMFDRRKSALTEKLHSQVTLGAEWLAEKWELRANSYVPLTGDKEIPTGAPAGSVLGNPFLEGSGIVVPVAGQQVIREEALWGGDIEAGIKLSMPGKDGPDLWMHFGGFAFDPGGDQSLTGGRGRVRYEITDKIALTAEGQYDDVRGRQGWLGVRFRMPFGGPETPPRGLKARMTAAPVRDVDIVTDATTVRKTPDQDVPVENIATSAPQRVLHVDNSAAPGGDGTLENPFNTLADGEAAMQPQDVLYVHAGDGTTTGQGQGVVIDDAGVQLIGSGVDFVYDGARFTHSSGVDFSGTVLALATSAPVITNSNANGDGITVTAGDTAVTGLTVNGASRHGIHVLSSGGADIGSVTVQGVTASNSAEDGIRVEADGAGSAVDAVIAVASVTGNHNGVRYYAQNDAAVSGAVTLSEATSNTQHGFILYDDSTAGGANVDMGGGGRSPGLNSLTGNGLEDLAVELDGGTLMAQNNWWGQASGPYQAAPAGGQRPQIYYGAPIHDGLVGHWTFDAEWSDNTTAYDRSGFENDGALQGGLSLADQVTGQNREALDFDGANDGIRVPHSGSLFIADEITVAVSIKGLPQVIDPWASYVMKNDLVTQAGWLLSARSNTGDIHARVDTDAAFNDTILVPSGLDGNWNNLVVTMNRGDMEAYMNLNKVSNPYPHGTGFANTADVFFGSFQGSTDFFLGWLDDVRVYNRALSASEISELNRMDANSSVDTIGVLSAAP